MHINRRFHQYLSVELVALRSVTSTHIGILQQAFYDSGSGRATDFGYQQGGQNHMVNNKRERGNEQETVGWSVCNCLNADINSTSINSSSIRCLDPTTTYYSHRVENERNQALP